MLADGGAVTLDVVGAVTAFLVELAALVALAMYLGRSWRNTGPVDGDHPSCPDDAAEPEARG